MQYFKVHCANKLFFLKVTRLFRVCNVNFRARNARTMLASTTDQYGAYLGSPHYNIVFMSIPNAC